MYTITVTEIGETAAALLEEKMLVLFGPSVPKELREICVVHDGNPTDDQLLSVGGTIAFDNQEYEIVDLGDAANANFGGLGHLAVLFGEKGELLPGVVRVMPETTPELGVGSMVVVRPAPPQLP